MTSMYFGLLENSNPYGNANPPFLLLMGSENIVVDSPCNYSGVWFEFITARYLPCQCFQLAVVCKLLGTLVHFVYGLSWNNVMKSTMYVERGIMFTVSDFKSLVPTISAGSPGY